MAEANVLQSFPDPTLINDNRVLERMLKLEDHYVPSSEYFNIVQTESRPFMRKIVVTWMFDVTDEQRCEDDVFPLAVNIFDRFLSVANIQKTHLQLLGSACMLLSSKLKETIPLSAEKLVVYTDNSITLEELLSWETLVLNKLRWDIAAIVPNDFLEYLFARMRLPQCIELEFIRKHSNSYIALCYIDFFFCVLNPPSMIAASAICTAISDLRPQLGSLCPSKSELLANISEIMGIDEDCLAQCQQRMVEVLQLGLGLQSVESTPEKMDTKSSDRPVSTPTDVLDIEF